MLDAAAFSPALRRTGGRCATCRSSSRTESRTPRLAPNRATERLRLTGFERVLAQTFGRGSSTTPSTWAQGPKSSEINSPAEMSLGRHPPPKPSRNGNVFCFFPEAEDGQPPLAAYGFGEDLRPARFPPGDQPERRRRYAPHLRCSFLRLCFRPAICGRRCAPWPCFRLVGRAT